MEGSSGKARQDAGRAQLEKVLGTPALGLLLSAAVILAGCGGAPTDAEGYSQDQDLRGITASATQTRFEESTGSLRAGITNNSDHAITVTRARILWPGFEWPTESLGTESVLPGQTQAFLVAPGAPRCEAALAAARIEAVIGGRTVTLPLHIDLPGLLARLHAAACAQQELDRVARVSLQITRKEVRFRSSPHFLGQVVLTRVPGTTTPVSVVDVRGSVAFELFARSESDVPLALPRALPRAASTVRVPVLVGPDRRCDAHARSQASQPFLFAIFTRLGDGAPPHRMIVVPDSREQLRLLDLVDRACGDVGEHDR